MLKLTAMVLLVVWGSVLMRRHAKWRRRHTEQLSRLRRAGL